MTEITNSFILCNLLHPIYIIMKHTKLSIPIMKESVCVLLCVNGILNPVFYTCLIHVHNLKAKLLVCLVYMKNVLLERLVTVDVTLLRKDEASTIVDMEVSCVSQQM